MKRDIESDPVFGMISLIKWLIILILFVVCACVFANVRGQQTAKAREIKNIIDETKEIHLEIYHEESEIKRRSSRRALESRLAIYESDLHTVGIEQTEELTAQFLTEHRDRETDPQVAGQP